MKLFRTRHLEQNNKLQRRTFMAALGVGIAAPLALKMSRMAVAAPGDRPTRLFIYFVPHGVPVEHYEPGDGFNLATGEGILSPLEPYKQHLSYLRGVSNFVGTNHAAIRSTHTGGEEYDSIDYLIAQQLGTTAHVLGTQSYRANSPGPDDDSKLVRHGAFVTPILNPADALDDLFAGISAGAPGVTDVEAEFRQEALSLTENEVAALQSEVSSLTTESNKLQIHLESLAALKAASSGEGASISCDMRPSLPSAEAMVGEDVFAHENFNTIIDGHLEAVAHAFICGSAKVATLQNMYANAQIPMNFPGGPGQAGNHHDPLSHSLDEGGRTNFATCQRWFYQKLVDKFISTLDVQDPLDPEHTVLDNTTILCTTEICDGNGHTSEAGTQWLTHAGGERYVSLPWTIIGGGGGCFSGGRVIDVDRIDHRNIMCAVAESMGVSLSNIAGEAVSFPTELRA